MSDPVSDELNKRLNARERKIRKEESKRQGEADPAAMEARIREGFQRELEQYKEDQERITNAQVEEVRQASAEQARITAAEVEALREESRNGSKQRRGSNKSGNTAIDRLTRAATRSGLRAASRATRAVGDQVRSKGLATLYFIISAVLIYTVEFVLKGAWSWRFAVYAFLLILNYLFFRDFELTKQAALYVLGIFAALAFFSLATVTSFISKYASSATVLLLVTLVVMPFYLWWMIIDSKDFEISGLVRTIGLVGMGAIILVTIGPSLSNAASVLPTPAGGFNAGAAAHDSLVHIATSTSSGVEHFVCLLGIGSSCSFATTWLGKITEPFAYDATTVDQIQNDNLGVYIVNPAVDGTIDVSGYGPADYLPKGITFQISAPIPPSVEFEICSAKGSTLKGFAGLCDRNVSISCDVQGGGATKIQPENNLTIRDAISSQGSLFSCRLQPPSDPSLLRGGYTSTSKTARITITYPFVTNTYKLIRAVDESQAYTTDAQKQLSSFSAPQIVSTGGPVIVQTSESKFIAVKDSGSTTTPLFITLKAKPDVQLDSVEQIGIYVPNGSELVSQPGTYCDFVTGPQKIAQENAKICKDAKGQSGTLTSSSSQCQSEKSTCDQGASGPMNTAILNACDYYANNCNVDYSETSPGSSSACTPIADVFGTKSSQPGTFYYLSDAAIRKINSDLGLYSTSTSGVNDFQGGNSIEINCDLKITNKNQFLSPDQLVTERAVNILSAYTVEQSKTVTVPFQGTLSTGSMTASGIGGTCQLTSSQLPKGVVPLQPTSGKVDVGDIFGAPRASGSHEGVDLYSSNGGNVVPAWDGTIIQICKKDATGESGCNQNYGNYVVVQTLYQGQVFKTTYGLLDSIPSATDTMGNDVVAGQTVLGTVQGSSASSGAHLHFEVQVNGKPIDPFPLIDDPASYDASAGQYQAAHAATTKAQCTTPVGPSTIQQAGLYLAPGAQSTVLSAINAVSGTTGRSCPSLTAQQYQDIVNGAEKYSIDPAFMFAIATVENHCSDTQATNGAGAVGMFQIVATTAKGNQITYCSDEWDQYKQTHPNTDYITAIRQDFSFQAACAADIAYTKWTQGYNWYRNGDQACAQFTDSSGKNACECSGGLTQTNINGYAATAMLYNGFTCPYGTNDPHAYTQMVGTIYKSIVENVEKIPSDQATTAYNNYTVGGTTTA